MTAIALAAAAAIAWGASDFSGGASADRTGVFSVIAVTELLGAVFLVPVLVATGLPAWNGRLLLAGLGGLAATLELAVIYRALSIGGAFITAPVGALGAAMTVTVGVLGGDRISVLVALALSCAVVGGGVSAVADTCGRGGLSLRRSVLACLLAAIGVAATQITLHAAGAVDPGWATAVEHLSTAGSAALIACAVALRSRSGSGSVSGSGSDSGPGDRDRLLPALRALPLLGLVAFTGTGGDLAFAAASHGPLSTVSAIASLYPLPTIMLAAALGGRRPRRMHALGIALALTGASLLGALSA